MGVDIRGRKGAMERVVDRRRMEPSQLHMTCQGGGDDVRLQNHLAKLDEPGPWGFAEVESQGSHRWS